MSSLSSLHLDAAPLSSEDLALLRRLLSLIRAELDGALARSPFAPQGKAGQGDEDARAQAPVRMLCAAALPGEPEWPAEPVPPRSRRSGPSQIAAHPFELRHE